MLSFPATKNRFPFKLGSTSYIIPADIIPNVRQLASFLDDIELILFESPNFSNIPSNQDIILLKKLALADNLSYTIHLPIDKQAGSTDKHERNLFCDAVSQIIDLFFPLSPAAWILHLEGILPDSNKTEITEWHKWCQETLDKILFRFPSTDSVAIENLSYPWKWHINIVTKYKTSYCCDVGHLWLYSDKDWKEHFISMLPKTKVIHLHGVSNGKDHIALSESKEEYIISFLEIIRRHNYKNIITLEVFNEQDLLKSIEVIKRLWAE